MTYNHHAREVNSDETYACGYNSMACIVFNPYYSKVSTIWENDQEVIVVHIVCADLISAYLG